MKRNRIEGKVVQVPIGPGAWGIIDQQGREWRPVNMPEQIKYPNQMVRVEIEEAEDTFDIYMWGKPVRIISFETMML